MDEVGFLGISIHALREEGDASRSACSARWYRFLSTPSARRATAGLEGRVSPRRISIHALREEGDGKQYAYRAAKWDISIHALREEGDNEEVDKMSVAEIFLSTPSARRATHRRKARFPVR